MYMPAFVPMSQNVDENMVANYDDNKLHDDKKTQMI